jgi:hypothetical protein
MNHKPQKTVMPGLFSGWILILICLLFPASSSAQVQATISNPPVRQTKGTNFCIKETVWNPATTTSPSTTVTLSLVRFDNTTAANLGSRSVPALPGGEISTETTCVPIPLHVGQGDYVIRATVDANGTSRTSRGAMAVTPESWSVTVRITTISSGRGCATAGREFQPPAFTICSNSQTTTVPADSVVVFNAWPLPAAVNWWVKPPSTFLGWSGGCSGTTPLLKKTINGNITCTATFSGP